MFVDVPDGVYQFDVIGGGEEGAKRHRHEFVVVDHRDPDHAGQRRSIRVPSPGWLLIVATPPTSAIR